MRIPSTLYHGTSPAHVGGIVSDGLVPSDMGQGGNYADLARPLSPFVYLTHGLALQYGMYASQPNPEVAVIKVDTSQLIKELFRPDEDYYLERVLVDQAPPDNMAEAVKIVLSRMEAEPERAEESLLAFGSVAYRGVIPVTAIKEIALFRPGKNVLTRLYMDLVEEARDQPYGKFARPFQAVLDRIFMTRNIQVQEIMTEATRKVSSARELREMQAELDAIETTVITPT